MFGTLVWQESKQVLMLLLQQHAQSTDTTNSSQDTPDGKESLASAFHTLELKLYFISCVQIAYCFSFESIYDAVHVWIVLFYMISKKLHQWFVPQRPGNKRISYIDCS